MTICWLARAAASSSSSRCGRPSEVHQVSALAMLEYWTAITAGFQQAHGGAAWHGSGERLRTDTIPRTGAGSPPPRAAEGHEPGAGEPPTERTEVITPDEQWAGHLRDTVPAMFMFAAMVPAFKQIDQGAYKVFRDRLLADCRATDPIEIMIIEQLSLAHFSMGLLSCKASNAGKVEAVGVYSQEPRQGSWANSAGSPLALQAYRAASRQLANDPTKDIVIPAAESRFDRRSAGEKCIDDELGPRTEEPMPARRSSRTRKPT